MSGTTWWIGLDSWVLQDGNYTDFVTGERRQFALEFACGRPHRLRPSPAGGPTRCEWTEHSTTYEVTGRLLRAAPSPQSDDAFVLDFGLPAYDSWMVLDDLQPPGVGEWLSGEVSLHVDHFAYMDHLATLPGIPPLIRTWTLDEIQLDMTPRMRVEHGHPLYLGPDQGVMLARDRSREAWQRIDRTRMWDDDDGDGGYRLRCTIEDDEPTSSMERSGPRSPYGPLAPRSPADS